MASAGELTRFWLTLTLAFVAMVFELRRGSIPNWLTLGALVPALGVAVLSGRTADALLGGLVAFGAAIAAWNRGGLGGGVVKTALLVGVAGGLVVGATLGLACLAFLALAAVAERSSHPRLRAFVATSVRITPAVFVLSLAGLVARHLLAARGWPT